MGFVVVHRRRANHQRVWLACCDIAPVSYLFFQRRRAGSLRTLLPVPSFRTALRDMVSWHSPTTTGGGALSHGVHQTAALTAQHEYSIALFGPASPCDGDGAAQEQSIARCDHLGRCLPLAVRV